MVVFLQLCAYCEATPEELVAREVAISTTEALDYVRIGGQQVLLCDECRQRFAPEAPSGLEQFLDGPIDFPPGVKAVEHCCPKLEFNGVSEDDATSVLRLERSGDYLVATCPHCGVTVRSLPEEEEL